MLIADWVKGDEPDIPRTKSPNTGARITKVMSAPPVYPVCVATIKC